MIIVASIPNAAEDEEIGAAEAYKTAVIFSHNPGGNVGPPWLAEMNANILQIAADVAHLRQRSNELPFIIANGRAGPRGSLFNPTAINNGWAAFLTAPNPSNRDELVQFTSKPNFHFLNAHWQ